MIHVMGPVLVPRTAPFSSPWYGTSFVTIVGKPNVGSLCSRRLRSMAVFSELCPAEDANSLRCLPREAPYPSRKSCRRRHPQLKSFSRILQFSAKPANCCRLSTLSQLAMLHVSLYSVQCTECFSTPPHVFWRIQFPPQSLQHLTQKKHSFQGPFEVMCPSVLSFTAAYTPFTPEARYHCGAWTA